MNRSHASQPVDVFAQLKEKNGSSERMTMIQQDFMTFPKLMEYFSFKKRQLSSLLCNVECTQLSSKINCISVAAIAFYSASIK